MKKLWLVVLFVVASLVGGSAPAVAQSSQTVVTFESVPADTFLGVTSPEYAGYPLDGLIFYNIGYGDWQKVVDSNGDHVVIDGQWADWSGAEDRIFSASGRPFYFHSMEYGSLTGGDGWFAIHVRAFDGGTQLASLELHPTTSGLTLTAADLGIEGVFITELRINLVSNGMFGGLSQFYYDDVRVTLPSIVIDGCDTGVGDRPAGQGLSIQQLIAQWIAQATEETNHGDFVSYVAAQTNALKKVRIITGDEKGMIQSCAAQATIGK